MKEGWDRKRLGDVLDVQNGYAFPSDNFNSSRGIPLIRIRSLKHGIETETRYEGPYEDKYVVNEGDLLIGMDGEFGCYEWKGGPSLLNQRVCRLQGFSGELLPRFLFYGLNDYLKAIEDVTGFATVKHLSSKQILAIEFPIPPLPEQQRIVALLDEAFAGLATAEANADRNLQNGKAILKAQLESVFSQPRAGWVERSLKEIGITQTGSTPKASDHSSYGDYISFVKPGDFKIDGTLEYCNSGLSKAGAESARIVPAGSVLMVCIGATIGKCGYSDRPITTNQQVNALTPSDGSLNRFLYYQMLTESFQKSVISASGQATLPIINKSKWSSLTVWLPPTVAQQVAITQEIDALADETQRLTQIYECKLAALVELKKSLLQRAFNGEL